MSKEIVIKAFVDDSCEMAKVYVNNKCIMEGNFWDFHPGCHGIDEYGDWNSLAQLVQQLYIYHRRKSPDAKISIERENYKYE